LLFAGVYLKSENAAGSPEDKREDRIIHESTSEERFVLPFLERERRVGHICGLDRSNQVLLR
jgi:hypothetical protein